MAPAQRLEVTRYQGDLRNPDNATAQTIALMCQQIDKASQDPLLRRAAKDAVQRFRGGPLYAAAGINPVSNPCAIAESAWWWVKHALKFQLHNSLIQVWFNERDQLQLLISPDLLLRMSKPRGDCAIYSMLVCAMLRAWGIPYELVTAAVTPNDPEFDHVWCRAILPDGRRLNLDASHGKYPGWQVPFEHRNRTQVWDSGGNQVEDVVPRHRALHGYYRRSGLGAGSPGLAYPSCTPNATPSYVWWLAGAAAAMLALPGNWKALGAILGFLGYQAYKCTGPGIQTAAGCIYSTQPQCILSL